MPSIERNVVRFTGCIVFCAAIGSCAFTCCVAAITAGAIVGKGWAIDGSEVIVGCACCTSGVLSVAESSRSPSSKVCSDADSAASAASSSV